jgi:rhodanese-related sulfurtransferase
MNANTRSETIATVTTIPPQAVAAMLDDGGEIAFVDAREEGVFARSHPLFAASLPLSRIEERAYALIPRLGTRVIVTSDGAAGGQLAGRAAQRLVELGYSNVFLLDGGNAGWKDAGYRLFSGIHVPSKAFGELAEARYETPMIEATELKALIDAGRDVAIFDSRPAHEYRRMNIPGAANCPGADLVYRLPAVVRSPDTLVVVNCAGRTRSIIGAQSLINAGLPNQVVALKNGTMGWHLAGLALEHGNERPVTKPDSAGVEAARRMAATVRARFGVRRNRNERSRTDDQRA